MTERLTALRDKIKEIFSYSMNENFREQIAALPTKLNEFGYDDFGFSPEWVKKALVPAVMLYRYYFRVEQFGVQNIPDGRVLLISNHSGQIPLDGVMIGVAVFLEGNPPRVLRSMVERWAQTLPFVSIFFTRIGQILGTPENARALLEKDEALLVFPEGARGINKVWKNRYQLENFGLGFMRLALETGTPIVPVGVVGAEEQLPSFGNFRLLAKLLNMPAVPLLPQLLIPIAGWLPLPTKYRIYFGEPMRFEGDANDEDVIIEEKVEEVRKRIQSMLTYGLKNRRHVFW
jgi:1-acyl-sn-glycerol-3-phosphate acyltransferase